jgi:predicted unusual protein kinase regulating ubiquinone biosynthesis (AarF/ABC1/UbiB family)
MPTEKPPSRLARLAQLGGLTGRVASKYVVERVKEAVSGSEVGKAALDRLHIDNARDIVETMSRLKGAAMKVGQQVAMFADGLDLPEEVGGILGKLHAKAEPIPFEVVRASIEKELERPLSEAFPFFDPTPLGTASLAQAHLARTPEGREVVVKVLHPGVEASVDTDLLALKGILATSRVLRRSQAELDDIFDEMRERLHEELDYVQEAANLEAYHRVYGADPRLRIPRAHPATSTERVLTLDRIPGRHVDAFLATATPEARQRAGTTLAHVYYEQVFQHRMLHADPHPGNYLFDEDGTVGILDFGCVKRFDPYWIGTYARAALALLDHDREAALAACVELGAWNGRDRSDAEALWGFLRGLSQGFDRGEVTLGPAHEQFIDEMRPAVKALIAHPNVRAPRHVIMLHRSLGGLYAMSRRLETRMDFGAVLRRHAEHAVRAAEGRA